MAIALAIIAGLGLGYILERGDFCFHSTLRGLFKKPPQLDLFRAYLVTLLIAVPTVNGMVALGWIEPWIAPLAWQANVLGGVIFGVGMVVAATCVTGLFYKLGHGMLGTLIGLLTWAIGDILTYRGPLSGLRDSLNSNPLVNSEGQTVTLLSGLGSLAPLLLLVAGGGALYFLWRSPRTDRGKLWNWLPLGIATGAFTSVAWLLAQAGGSNYTYGTSSVPTQIFNAATGSGELFPWIPVSLIALIPGALIAAVVSGNLWVRGETARRYLELAGGGLLMGIGAGISGGCNLGHSLVGVPLLSLGSIATTLSMAIGVYIAQRIVFARPVSQEPNATQLESF